jgi:mRNA-degrading endonuclease RelE of RelBE toxin-antitoxin system
VNIFYSHKAARWLAGAPPSLQDRIEEKMYFFAAQQDPLRFAKFITKRDMYRFRIGNYRILFIIKNSAIQVAEIERRDKAYD